VIHPFFKGGAKIRLFTELPNSKTVFQLQFIHLQFTIVLPLDECNCKSVN